MRKFENFITKYIIITFMFHSFFFNSQGRCTFVIISSCSRSSFDKYFLSYFVTFVFSNSLRLLSQQERVLFHVVIEITNASRSLAGKAASADKQASSQQKGNAGSNLIRSVSFIAFFNSHSSLLS